MICDFEILVENYKEVIALLCKQPISEEKLEELKQYFEQDIDSVRTYDWIRSIDRLFQILERRAVLGPKKISNLFVIASKVRGSKKIGSCLNRQSKILSKIEPDDTPLLFSFRLLSDKEPPLPEPVRDCMVTNIKNSWQSFARALKVIKEGAIDGIEVKDTRNEDKIREVIEIYLYEARLQRLLNPYNVLLTALEKIKRRDVREQVEELLKENLINST